MDGRSYSHLGRYRSALKQLRKSQNTKDKAMTDTMNTETRVFGYGEYEARWIQRSSLVKLTAKGILPCSNYRAQLEQRPE